jgi:hypothetical protein
LFWHRVQSVFEEGTAIGIAQIHDEAFWGKDKSPDKVRDEVLALAPAKAPDEVRDRVRDEVLALAPAKAPDEVWD